ncbi:MAG: LysM peptidoglycan-binding domain-containing protein [Candidatus Cloacimonadaceae bacterium]|nr:LysM peptidoglycan-binding domain-containing protein [Candidatus Cloacimonadaceae bacterium]
MKLYRYIWLMLLLTLLPHMAWAQTQTHVVKKGDTLYALGRVYNMTVKEIQELNNLSDINLSIGQKLKVKAKPKPQSPAPVVPSPTPAVTTPPAAQSTPAVPSTQISPERPASRIQRSSLSADFFYEIQRGDNLYRISKTHNITMDDLLLWNDFADTGVSIYPGQRVIIKDPFSTAATTVVQQEAPASSDQLTISAPIDEPEEKTVVIEKVYIVQPKDTLFRIAKDNDTTVDELKRINSLTSNSLNVGQKIYIAGSPRPVDQTTMDRLTEEELLKKDRIRSDLVLPVVGKVLSEYGLRNGKPHKGIDIGAKHGTPIYAVLDGTVVYSGVQGAYGNVVVLEHPDFVMTVYAHNEKNLVKVGDKVEKAQQIAMVGSTGNASGSHLHFEYRIKGKAINPRKVLPLD